MKLTQWGLLGLFGGLGALSYVQASLLLKSSGQGSASQNATAQTMQARLNGVSLGIMAYLQDHDPASLERIKSEGHEASRLLAELKEAAGQSGNAADFSPIEKAHEEMRQAALTLLAADHTQIKTRQALNDSHDALVAVLTDKIESSIKPNQINSSARLRNVQYALAEAREWSKDSFRENALQASQKRFMRDIGAYEELSRTRRASHWADEARSIFTQGISQAQGLIQAEAQKQTALQRYTEKRNVLDVVLQESGFSGGHGFVMSSIAQIFSSGLVYSVLIGMLLLLATILVIGWDRQTSKHLAEPLQDILVCVEAAASGDVSRLPDHWSQDEVGQLAQAVGRLITVLARSENLVYHLAALVESSGEAIISHTLDGTILSWNKGAQRIYGYSAEQVKGQSIALLCPYDDGAEMMQNLQKIQRGERLQPFETIHQASNGRTVKALVRVSAILDSTRKVIGASFCAQELTDIPLIQEKSAEESEIV